MRIVIKNWEKPILLLLSGIALTTTVVTIALLLIQNSGLLIERYGEKMGLHAKEVKQFAEIFGQLQQAEFDAGWLASGLVCLLLCIGCDFIFRKKTGTKKWVFSLLIVLVLFLPLVLFGTCTTRVNGILFGDTLRVLIPLLASGGL
ncbi:MAG: hypothetical protein E7487_08695 [Ruminococcaceae bacterium]|nr:hypothetical protein [Oscillospiraceae bacterium]